MNSKNKQTKTHTASWVVLAMFAAAIGYGLLSGFQDRGRLDSSKEETATAVDEFVNSISD